jgi:hypothetical protein
MSQIERMHGSWWKCRAVVAILLVVGVGVLGCGETKSLNVVQGTVQYDGQPVEIGEIRFVPIGSEKAPASYGRIANGRYEISARGGVPSIKHRVEITAYRKTGRKVPGKPPAAEISVDELVPVGSAAFRGEASPLVAESDDIRSGRADFVIPKE